jgi:hypothetical protein
MHDSRRRKFKSVNDGDISRAGAVSGVTALANERGVANCMI